MVNIIVLAKDRAEGMSLQAQLGRLGHAVHLVFSNDSCRALLAAESTPIGLVISDFILTIAIMRPYYENVPLILTLTLEDRLRSSRGNIGIVMRPFSFETLQTTISEFLE